MTDIIKNNPLTWGLFSSQYWAMGKQQIDAMASRLDGMEFTIDPSLFHTASKFESTAIYDFGRRVEGTNYTSISGNIGILELEGPIIPRATWFSDVSGIVSIDKMSSEFDALEKNPQIDRIVIMIDSPGGQVDGISSFAKQIKESKKIVESHVIGMAASGGYWIASATDKITAVDTSTVGSIGVVTTIVDRKEQNEKRGVRVFDIVASQSPRKRTDLTTEEGRSELQSILDGMADIFINSVADGRNTDYENVLNNFGRGGMKLANEAMRIGMIDRIVSTRDFLKELSNKPRPIISTAATEERSMPGENIAQVTQPVVETIDTSSIEATARESAKNEAIERFKAFEGITTAFSDYPKDIQDKVKATVDEEKYKENSSVEMCRGKCQQLALNAMNVKLEAARQQGQEIAEKVSGTGLTGQSISEEDRKIRIKNMKSGYAQVVKQRKAVN